MSLTVHGAAAAALIFQPGWIDAVADNSPRPLQIEVTTLSPPGAGAQDDQPLVSVATPAATPQTPEVEVPLPQTGNTPADQATASPVLPDVNLSALGPSAVSVEASVEPVAAPGPDQADVTDPRLVELFNRIRDRLNESCLLALPALRGENQIQLGILAADDRRISALMRELTENLTTEVAEAAVLLDRRQCPALAFVRRDPQYPVLDLGLRLDSQDVSSGGALRGQIMGGAGWYNTLLLIDDNGVVHDLRRFLIRSADQILFDVPLARAGASRDTHQLVMAIATRTRPETISARSGELAERFFDRLTREIGPEAMIGVSSVYVR